MVKRGGMYRLVVLHWASLVNSGRQAPRGFVVFGFLFYFSLIVLI